MMAQNVLILIEVGNVETYMLYGYLIFLEEDYDNFDVDLRGCLSFYII
jgi:hypothetical protein